jgi:radical SAM protein with 4Fe4S-binding SPASM domain
MPRERAIEVAAELRALGCERLTLSGGEPTLSPYWEDVAREASRLGVRVNLITNGLYPARELVRRAKDAGLEALGTSLEGLEATHDRNRGRAGMFGKVMELVEAGQAEGLPIAVITTLTRASSRELPALCDLLAGQVYAWQLQLGAAMGNLGDHRDEQVEPRDLLTLVPLIAELIQAGKAPIHVGDNLGYYGRYESVLRRRRSSAMPCWIGCYAGCRHLGIEADGGVKGCLSIQCSRETEGNLCRESLRDIWLRPGVFAHNREFSLADLGGFCQTCEYAEICRGGCLSMRACEGGRDNRFCYHRVATLEARQRRGRLGYTPVAVVPTALLALLGVGCGGEVTGPADAAGPADARPADAQPDRPITPVYMMPADAYGIQLVDAYGMRPVDAQSDHQGAPLYGFDAGMPVDPYGMQPVDAGTMQPADAYVPPDAAPDAPPDVGPVDLYGIPAYAVSLPPSRSGLGE